MTRRTKAAYWSVLDDPSPAPWCQRSLDIGSCAAGGAGHGSLLLPRCPGAGLTAWGLHPHAEVVEPGVEVKLRLLDALDWQRLRASGLCSCGGGGPKDHAFSRCLTGADGVIRSRTG